MKKWKIMRAMTWIKEVLREDCAVAVAVAVAVSSCSGNKASSASIGSKASDDNVQRTRPPERRSSKRMRERALGRQSKRKFGVEKKKALKEGALS